jgi:hypothetical protein
MSFLPRPHTRGRVKPKGSDDSTGAAVVAIGVGALVLIMFLIALTIFGIYCLVKCSHKLPTWLVVLWVIAFLIPPINGLAIIAIIVYYYAEGCGKVG